MGQTTRSLPTLVNLQARILEKQESVQERKAKRKVPWPPSSLSCTLKHFIGTGENIRDSRGSTGDQGCAGDEGAGGAPFLHLLQTDSHEKWEDWSIIESMIQGSLQKMKDQDVPQVHSHPQLSTDAKVTMETCQ